jgi:nucleoid-associated protein YgaU
MPNDAKLGMVFGVGLVIIVAVIFFRKDSTAGDPFATIPKSAPAVTQPAPARGAHESAPHGGGKHLVEDGDTLIDLSRRYYGTGEKFNLIYNANRDQLGAPDRLRPGMVLTIPETH